MKKKDIHIWRRTIQTGVAGLFIMLPLLNAAGFSFVWGNFLNMHIGSLTFSDPLAVFQVIVQNQYLPVGLLISAGTVLAIALFLGTVFCSWICPFGFLSELTNTLSSRTRHRKPNTIKIQKYDFKVKAVFFCTGFLIIITFFNSPAFNMISLPFQYSNIFQYLFIQKHVSAGIWFIGIILLIEFIFRSRLWCRWFCPQSVLVSISKHFNPFRLKINFDKKRCVGKKTPHPCQKACSLGLDPRHLTGLHETECTNCGDCVDACKKTGKALCFGFGPGK